MTGKLNVLLIEDRQKPAETVGDHPDARATGRTLAFPAFKDDAANRLCRNGLK